MLIDCDSCQMRGLACSDCVVSVLLGADGGRLGGEEQQAIDVLAEAGLVPPLRLVVADGVEQPESPASGEAGQPRREGALRPRSAPANPARRKNLDDVPAGDLRRARSAG